MGKEQSKNKLQGKLIQGVIDEIKRNPQAFILSPEELEEVIAEREELDRGLKERGLTVI